MKAFLLLCLILALVFAEKSFNDMDINIDKTYDLNNQDIYVFSWKGANGYAKFAVEGLPSGIRFDTDRIIVSNDVPAGNYIIKITATDSAGNTISRLVNLGLVTTL